MRLREGYCRLNGDACRTNMPMQQGPAVRIRELGSMPRPASRRVPSRGSRRCRYRFPFSGPYAKSDSIFGKLFSLAVRFLLRRAPPERVRGRRFHATGPAPRGAGGGRARARRSTGCGRRACDQLFEIARGIEIPVDLQAAGGAAIGALREAGGKGSRVSTGVEARDRCPACGGPANLAVRAAPQLRLPARRGGTAPVICCLAQGIDPLESNRILRLRCRSASKPHAEQQNGLGFEVRSCRGWDGLRRFPCIGLASQR